VAHIYNLVIAGICVVDATHTFENGVLVVEPLVSNK